MSLKTCPSTSSRVIYVEGITTTRLQKEKVKKKKTMRKVKLVNGLRKDKRKGPDSIQIIITTKQIETLRLVGRVKTH